MLVVEDDATSRLLVGSLLKRHGHHVSYAVNGTEALTTLSQQDFDVVLMDVQIPDMNGREVTRVVRDPLSSVRNHAVPVIAVTALAMRGDETACLQAGMDAYLSKPVEAEDLLRLVDAVVASRG